MAPYPLDKQTASCYSSHNWLAKLALDLALLCYMWQWRIQGYSPPPYNLKEYKRLKCIDIQNALKLITSYIKCHFYTLHNIIMSHTLLHNVLHSINYITQCVLQHELQQLQQLLANDREAIQQLKDRVSSLEQTIQQLTEQLKMKVSKDFACGPELFHLNCRMMSCLKHLGSYRRLVSYKRQEAMVYIIILQCYLLHADMIWSPTLLTMMSENVSVFLRKLNDSIDIVQLVIWPCQIWFGWILEL